MSRLLLRLFPRRWRERYGDELAEQLAADGRRVATWWDVVVVASCERWRQLRGGDHAVPVVVAAVLAAAAACDVALGVGMDERTGPHLASHWWGAPFAAVYAAGALAAVAASVAVVRSGRLPAAVVAFLTLAGAASAGSAAGAAVDAGLATWGAAAGLAAGAAAGRWLVGGPPGRADLALALAVPLLAWLGLRAASGPLGPLVLLGVGGLLVAGRASPRPAPPLDPGGASR